MKDIDAYIYSINYLIGLILNKKIILIYKII